MQGEGFAPSGKPFLGSFDPLHVSYSHLLSLEAVRWPLTVQRLQAVYDQSILMCQFTDSSPKAPSRPSVCVCGR